MLGHCPLSLTEEKFNMEGTYKTITVSTIEGTLHNENQKSTSKGMDNKDVNLKLLKGDLKMSADSEKGLKKRDKWSSKVQFLLACVGYSVGFGNVWRFPYLCYKNGGGAFLIPYFICVVIAGLPLFYLEVSVGQFMGLCGFPAWKICPILQGIGLTANMVIFFLNIYYNVIICWAFYYVFSSFATELPWATCGHWWNTEYCFDASSVTATNVSVINATMDGTTLSFLNDTVTSNVSVTSTPLLRIDPVTEFWENKVLSISDGIEHMGTLKWDLALCLLLSWIVVYVCICKGIKTSGKVLYVTAIVPFFFMFALLIRNSLLEGSLQGVIYYLKPDPSRLSDIEVWVDAGTQIFWSYSVGNGALLALGSYNKFYHNSYRDVGVFALINTFTSILAGFLIFTILGHMAHEQDIPIDKVAASGPGLAFIAYPKAVSLMPGAPVWSALFFIMLILLGIDSQFVSMEGFISAIVDIWPRVLRKGHRKEIFVAITCLFSFLVGLLMVTEGGMYVFQIFDYYSNIRGIVIVAFFECVAISWIYGINRFYDNLEMMLGKRIVPYMWICWTVFTPAFCFALFVMSGITYSELDYKRPTGTYVYPGWAVAIGWVMAMSSAVWIPVLIFYRFAQNGFSIKVLYELLKPQGLEEHQLREKDKKYNKTEGVNGYV